MNSDKTVPVLRSVKERNCPSLVNLLQCLIILTVKGINLLPSFLSPFQIPQNLQHSAQVAAEERAVLTKLYTQTSMSAEQMEIILERLQLSRLIKGYNFSPLLLNQCFCRSFSLCGVSSPLSLGFTWLRIEKVTHTEHKRVKSLHSFD